MTGPEHYAEAERILRAVTKPGSMLPESRMLTGDPFRTDYLAWAQAHATLALAAATALAAPDLQEPTAIDAEWHEVAGGVS